MSRLTSRNSLHVVANNFNIAINDRSFTTIFKSSYLAGHFSQCFFDNSNLLQCIIHSISFLNWEAILAIIASNYKFNRLFAVTCAAGFGGDGNVCRKCSVNSYKSDFGNEARSNYDWLRDGNGGSSATGTM